MIADLNQDDSTQSELVPKVGQRTIISPSGKIITIIPRGGDNNQPGKPSKFSPGSKAKGAAKRDFARRQTGKKPTSGRSGGSPFAQAFTVEPNLHGQVEIEMDCWVDFLLNRLRTHAIQGAQVDRDQ